MKVLTSAPKAFLYAWVLFPKVRTSLMTDWFKSEPLFKTLVISALTTGYSCTRECGWLSKLSARAPQLLSTAWNFAGQTFLASALTA